MPAGGRKAESGNVGVDWENPKIASDAVEDEREGNKLTKKALGGPNASGK